MAARGDQRSSLARAPNTPTDSPKQVNVSGRDYDEEKAETMSVGLKPPPNTRIFRKSSVIKTSLANIKGFHEAPQALASLTPPPMRMRVNRDERRSITEGEIDFTLFFGLLPIRWVARHETGPTADSFADIQVKGPLAYWRHEHIFTVVAGGVELTDRITLAHRPGFTGLVTRLAFDGLPLRLLFVYRHWRAKRDLLSTGES